MRVIFRIGATAKIFCRAIGSSTFTPQLACVALMHSHQGHTG